MIRQIYEEIGSQILRGELAIGDRLPSSRGIAAELGVSRNVALEAYELLEAEGFVFSMAGTGTFIAESAGLEARPTPPPTPIAPEVRGEKTGIAVIDYRSGTPALDLLPMTKWAQLEYSAFVDAEPGRLGYAPPEGCRELRETLYQYLRRKRGIECEPDQIIITTGAMQARSSPSSPACSPRPSTTMLFEDPTSAQIRKVFSETGPRSSPSQWTRKESRPRCCRVGTVRTVFSSRPRINSRSAVVFPFRDGSNSSIMLVAWAAS